MIAKKQKVVAQSTSESKYIVAAKATSQVMVKKNPWKHGTQAKWKHSIAL